MRQQSSCSINDALRFFAYIKGLGIIVHGPTGCGGATANEIIMDLELFQNKETIITYICYEERDVIFSCADKILAAVSQFIETYSMKNIVLLRTCLPVIIGENYDFIVKQVKNKYPDTNLMIISCEGMSHINHYDYFKKITSEFFNYIIQPKEGNIKDYDINVLNAFDIRTDDYKEIYRLLFPLKLKVRYLPYNSHINEIKDMDNGKLTIALCSTAHKHILKSLSERGMHVLNLDPPFGIFLTDKWLRQIAEALQIHEIEKIIYQEKNKYNNQLLEIQKQLKGKKVVITAGNGRLLEWTRMCIEIGLEVIAVGCIHAVYEDKEILYSLTGLHCQDIVQWKHICDWIDYYKPDFYFGKQASSQEIKSKPVKTVPMDKLSYYGYKGLINLGNIFINKLKYVESSLVAQIQEYYNDYNL